MIEKEVVYPIMLKIKKRCDNCGVGYMERVNDFVTLSSCPPQYEHSCNRCKHIATYTDEYPHYEWQFIDISRIMRGEEQS